MAKVQKIGEDPWNLKTTRGGGGGRKLLTTLIYTTAQDGWMDGWLAGQNPSYTQETKLNRATKEVVLSQKHYQTWRLLDGLCHPEEQELSGCLILSTMKPPRLLLI